MKPEARPKGYELLASDPGAQLDIRRKTLAKTALHRSDSDHRELVGQVPKRLNHEFGPLVRDQSLHPQKWSRFFLCRR